MSPAAPSGRASATNAPVTTPVVATPRTRAVRGGIVAFISCLVVAAPAPAQDVSPTPSLDQYIESVPGARGSRPTTGRGNDTRPTLPADARKNVREDGGADARALEDVATDPALGAPPDATAVQSPSRQDEPRRPVPPAEGTGGADTGGGGGSWTVLIVGLVAITALAAVAAAARRRSATLS